MIFFSFQIIYYARSSQFSIFKQSFSILGNKTHSIQIQAESTPDQIREKRKKMPK